MHTPTMTPRAFQVFAVTVKHSGRVTLKFDVAAETNAGAIALGRAYVEEIRGEQFAAYCEVFTRKRQRDGLPVAVVVGRDS